MTDIIFEHRFYLPSALLVPLMVVLCDNRYDLLRRHQRTTWISVGLITALLSSLTIIRNLEYSSAVELARIDLQRQADNPRNWYLLANLDENASPDQRRLWLQRAIELSQRRNFFYPGTKYKWSRELADEYFVSGQLDEAKGWYQFALAESNDLLQQTEVQWSLAIVASLVGSKEIAEYWFGLALQGHEQIREQIQETYNLHSLRYDKKSS